LVDFHRPQQTTGGSNYYGDIDFGEIVFQTVLLDFVGGGRWKQKGFPNKGPRTVGYFLGVNSGFGVALHRGKQEPGFWESFRHKVGGVVDGTEHTVAFRE
jgi:hypothetical protein